LLIQNKFVDVLNVLFSSRLPCDVAVMLNFQNTHYQLLLFCAGTGTGSWMPQGLRGPLPLWGPSAPPPWAVAPPSAVFRRPMDAMVDLTNDLGVAILQVGELL